MDVSYRVLRIAVSIHTLKIKTAIFRSYANGGCARTNSLRTGVLLGVFATVFRGGSVVSLLAAGRSDRPPPYHVRTLHKARVGMRTQWASTQLSALTVTFSSWRRAFSITPYALFDILTWTSLHHNKNRGLTSTLRCCVGFLLV